jgi:hypothetical protein
MTRGFGSP